MAFDIFRGGKNNSRGPHGKSPINGLTPAPSVALDRFGRVLKAGQLVLYRPPMDLIFEVVSVGSALDPRAPQGAITLALYAKVPVSCAPGVPLGEIVIVGEKTTVADEPGAGAEPSTPEPTVS